MNKTLCVNALPEAELDSARDFLKFVDASPSPYHAVESSASMLLAAGYERISESSDSSWEAFAPGGKYFFTRNQSTLFAFHVGGQYERGNGATIMAAHTDSPVLRVKPISTRTAAGLQQVAVETYGGGLWNTWFDRDLSVAGRVIVASEDNSVFKSHLIKIDRPLLRIPNLAIHLNREIRSEGFKPNSETHCVPIIASEAKAALNGCPTTVDKEEGSSNAGITNRNHSSVLLRVLSEELNVSSDRIRDFELSLFDTQPSALGGAFNEFVFAPRLDNLMMSFCCVRSLIDSEHSIEQERNLRVVALFDHEEIGSSSAQGAASNMMLSVLERISGAAALPSSLRRSFLVSADMAHAFHPNYTSKHEPKHTPHMHKGVVIKHNCNQRYATNSASAFLLKEIARRHSIPIQEFVVRNDMGCGSTIGPILASSTGMRTIDIGIAQLAMHSIREMCGTEDIHNAIALLRHIYEDFPELDLALTIDEI